MNKVMLFDRLNKIYLRAPLIFIKHDLSQLFPLQVNYRRNQYIQPCLSCCNNYLKNNNVYLTSSSVVLPDLALSQNCENKQEINLSAKGRVFADRETQFHHDVLKNGSAYSSTIFKFDHRFSEKYRINEKEYMDFISVDNWDSKSVCDVVRSFISLGLYSSFDLNITMDDERFDKLISAFTDKCSSLSEDQLIDCMIALQIWPKSEDVRARNFLKVWKALDDICLQKIQDWSIDKMLYMIDLWFQIRLTRLSLFIYKGLMKISNKSDSLTSAQMIQTLFYMSCTRKLHPAIVLHEYEHYIQKHITSLSIEEIGIFAIAFFKTKTYIRNTKLLTYMMQRVLEEADTIHQITLTGITKALRLSHKPEIGFTANDFVMKMMEKKADSLNLMNITHLMHVTTQLQFYNEEAITKLAEKFCSDPSAARLKELERVAFILSLFNYIPLSTPNIVETIIQQLDDPRHVSAGENYPLTLLSLVYFLTLLRGFPEKQIRHLLNEDNIKKKYDNRFTIDMQVVQIDYNRVLEGPPGSEHLLSPSLREYLAKRYSMYLPSPDRYKNKNKFDQMMLEVMDLTKEVLGGDQYSLATYVLPHFPRADIVFHLDDNGKPVAIPEEMRTSPQFKNVVRPPNDKGWYAVIIGGRNMYTHNVPRLVGEQAAKLRQLRLLGYSPIVIPSYYWNGEKNKADFLRLKYFSNPG